MWFGRSTRAWPHGREVASTRGLAAGAARTFHAAAILAEPISRRGIEPRVALNVDQVETRRRFANRKDVVCLEHVRVEPELL
jgi:hypothetical protein